MRGRVKNRVVFLLLAAVFVAVLATVVVSQNIKPEIEQAIQVGDTAKAITLLDNEIAMDPSNPWNYYTKGMIFFNQMRYQKASTQFNEALDKRGKHYESMYRLGLCYLNLGELDKAQELMEEGVKKDKKNKHVFQDGYGQVMLAKKQWQEADRAFRQAIVGDSTNPQYHIHLGDANFYQGVPALAIIEFEKALAVDTGSLEVYYHWAEACLEMKDYACAIEKLRIVLTKDSTHAPAWMRAGGIYFKAGLSSRNRGDRSDRFKDAIGSYRRYIELSQAQPDSTNVRVFFEMAMSYSELRGYEDAAEYFDRVLSIPMEPRDIYFHYGKALWYNKDYDKSAEMLLKHLEWVKQQPETYNSSVEEYEIYQLLGDSYFYRKPKDFVTAAGYYRKSLEAKSEQERIVYNLAVSYHMQRSFAQALEYYDKRIELGIDSSAASVYKNAGNCAFSIATTSADDEDEDIDGDEEGAGDPTNMDVNYYEVAADYLDKYLNLVSDDLDAAERIAYIYLYQLSDCTNGVKYYENVLALDPGNCGAQKALGYAYFGGDICSKNYGKALQYLLKAQACISGSTGECADFDLVLWVAQCYHLLAADKENRKENASEDYKNANTWYKKALKCDPGSKEAKEGADQTEYLF